MSKTNIIKSQRGSILIELVISCLILVQITIGIIEIFTIIRDDIYLYKIAREGAREAAMTRDISKGLTMAEDAAHEYFTGPYPSVLVNANTSGSEISNVMCVATYNHKYFSFLRKNGVGGITLDAKAIYPWWDENT